MTLLVKRIINRLGRPYGINPFPRAFEYGEQADAASLTERFDQIFEHNYWGSDDSHSGVGSTATFASRYAQQLAELIRERGFYSMFDGPCGDLRWMHTLLQNVDIDYIGGDVSKQLIDAISSRFPELTLRHFDLTRDAFPNAQLWHCRDCLFHLSFDDIRKVFSNALRSNCEYVLLTTHRSRFMHRNLDVGSGGFRMLDLQREPFNLPPAQYYLKDSAGSEFPRYVGLWPTSSLEHAITGLEALTNSQHAS